MSWHDPARSLEPETDSILRDELRDLLGMPAQSTSYFECEASPDLIRLADSLRQEARRRNHTAQRRSSWMLVAAALPLALAMGGLGVWGLAEQHKADHRKKPRFGGGGRPRDRLERNGRIHVGVEHKRTASG